MITIMGNSGLGKSRMISSVDEIRSKIFYIGEHDRNCISEVVKCVTVMNQNKLYSTINDVSISVTMESFSGFYPIVSEFKTPMKVFNLEGKSLGQQVLEIYDHIKLNLNKDQGPDENVLKTLSGVIIPSASYANSLDSLLVAKDTGLLVVDSLRTIRYEGALRKSAIGSGIDIAYNIFKRGIVVLPFEKEENDNGFAFGIDIDPSIKEIIENYNKSTVKWNDVDIPIIINVDNFRYSSIETIIMLNDENHYLLDIAKGHSDVVVLMSRNRIQLLSRITNWQTCAQFPNNPDYYKDIMHLALVLDTVESNRKGNLC